MEKRKANWYTIARYKTDDLTGEVINVGIIMHTLGGDRDTFLKYFFIDENSDKIKGISESQTDIMIYKSYRDNLEFYLQESVENLFGEVGEVKIDSPSESTYLESLYDACNNEKLFLTRPKFSLTHDVQKLFESLFTAYVGSRYLPKKDKQISTKRYLKRILEEKELLHKKVISDHVIKPIQELDNVQIKIDFSFKNGVWNYLQGVPAFAGPSQNTEWFAKTKFMFDNLDKDAKIRLLYRSADMNNKEYKSMLDYFSGIGENIVKLDIEDKNSMDDLFDQIANEAQDIEDLMIS